MATWLRETFSDLFRQDTAWSARLNRRLLLGRLIDLLVILLRDGGAYALLLVMAVRGELRPDEFVLYFSAISGFATFIGNMISAWNEMQTASLKVSDYRQFMELPDTDGTGRRMRRTTGSTHRRSRSTMYHSAMTGRRMTRCTRSVLRSVPGNMWRLLA